MRLDVTRGHLETLLLAVLERGPGHGYAICETLRERSSGRFDLAEGTLYPALHRLEAAGLIASRWVSFAGRQRRVYELTRAGLGELARARSEWAGFASAVQSIVGASVWAARRPVARS